VICAVLAPGKRRSAVGWFCIGFLIPLIGVILILVLQPLPDPNQMAYGYPPQGYPPQGYPPQGYAPPGYAPAGPPPPGYQAGPPPGYPPPGYPPQGGPPPGYPYQQQGAPPPGYPQAAPPPGFPPQDAELHQLDDQRMRGAIGDQEYQAKRAELLARRPS
jgi:hypothetical protein